MPKKYSSLVTIFRDKPDGSLEAETVNIVAGKKETRSRIGKLLWENLDDLESGNINIIIRKEKS